MASQSDSSKDQSSLVVFSGPLLAHSCRMHPGQDFSKCLRQAARVASDTGKTSAVAVLSTVGSLSNITLRMANAQQGQPPPLRTWNEAMEIVSLSGTFAVSNERVQFHLHLAVSDSSGKVFGGHLVDGTVHTTVELVLGSIGGVNFDRVLDGSTGYRELDVSRNH